MKFVPLLRDEREDQHTLSGEYRSGRGIGVITLGQERFFFRKRLTVYYIPYGQISRYFRRVVALPAKLGCCDGELRVENVVICAEERELAQIQIPGERAALALMEELKRRAPRALSVCP